MGEECEAAGRGGERWKGNGKRVRGSSQGDGRGGGCEAAGRGGGRWLGERDASPWF